MCAPLTSPAEAYPPDADRAGPKVAAQVPDWLIHCLALLILFLLKHWLAVRSPRSPQLPSWWHDRPDIPPGSAQAFAAAIRGPFGNAIACMCFRRGIGPGHAEWPEMSRAIVAFGGSLEVFSAGVPPCALQWRENPTIFPGMHGVTAATPAATAIALLLARQAVADSPPLPPPPKAVAAEAGRALLPAAWLPASQRQGFIRPGTGPPTGPPAAWACGLGPPPLSCLKHGAGARSAPPY
jgi:hypothetical protein